MLDLPGVVLELASDAPGADPARPDQARRNAGNNLAVKNEMAPLLYRTPVFLGGRVLRITLRCAFVRATLAASVLGATLCACNGNITVPAATPTPAQGSGATGVLTTSTTGSSSLIVGPFGGGYLAKVTAPDANAATNLTVAASLTAPAGLPAVTGRLRRQNIDASNVNVFGYETWTPASTVTFVGSFALAWVFPPGVTPPDPANSYVAFEDPNDPAAGFNVIAGPATVSSGGVPGSAVGSTIFGWGFPAISLTFDAGATYDFVLFSTTSTLSTPSPAPVSPTPMASASASPTPIASASPSPAPSSSASASASPSPSPSGVAGFEVETATASGNGIVTIQQQSGSQAAFAVAASDDTSNTYTNGEIVVNLNGLPLTAQICATNPSTGQCSDSTSGSPYGFSIASENSETFSVFLTSEGSSVNGTVTVTFEDSNGNVLGQGSVTVQSTNS
jgi:hypothetical protein